MAENLEVVLRHRPEGMPVASDFQIVQRDIPSGAPRDGLLVRVIALSLDPYLGAELRGRHMGRAAPAPGASLPGSALAEVLVSDHLDFERGDYVVEETSLPPSWSEVSLVCTSFDPITGQPVTRTLYDGSSGPDASFPDNKINSEDRTFKFNQMIFIAATFSIPTVPKVSE